MDLRITPQTVITNALARNNQIGGQLGKLQEQASTGKRLLNPSDGPTDIGPLLASKAQDSRLDTYLNSIANARSLLDNSVSNLTEVGNVLTQARAVALEGGNSTNTPEALNSLAQEVDQLLTRLLDLANAQQNGQYLYAGAASQTRPFSAIVDNLGRPQAVAYLGSDQRGVLPISPNDTVAAYYAGKDIFQSRTRGLTTFTGNTGAAAGTGTDSATGQGTLLVRHVATTYAGASGVGTGSTSASGDTIIGPSGAHQLTITDTSGTGAFGAISLNGGPSVNFTSADTNLKVTGPNGEVVFLDTTAIAAGFNGTVNITADGTLSTDGGVSSIPIDFTANQVVQNSLTGAVTNVASANIRAVGKETLNYQGTYDAFQILMALRDDLRNTQGLSEGHQLALISSRVAELDRIKGGILHGLGEQAASLQSLENREQSARDAQLAAHKMVSNLEDADLTKVLLQLQNQENLLKAMLVTTKSLLDLGILNYL